jgi:hypothetical protein
MCLTNGDNFGMVVKGEEALYKQRTLFQDIIIRMSRLIKLRIHHENVSERLSRRPTNDWLELCREDLIEMETAQQTVAVTDDDFSVLMRVVLEGIHLVIELETANRIRYTMNLRRMIMKKFYDEYTEEHGHPPPDTIDEQELPPAYIGQIFMCDRAPAASMSRYVAADDRLFYRGLDDSDFPDEFFVQHEERSEESQFDKWLNVVDCSFGFRGKGHATGTKRSRFKGKFHAFFGAFHACLKLHNSCGLLFGNFLGVFFVAWRDTLNKINWILYPSDPRQLENELYQYVLAHYCSAFLYLWESWGKKADRVPSPAGVHKYMLDRSKDCPFRQAILI